MSSKFYIPENGKLDFNIPEVGCHYDKCPCDHPGNCSIWTEFSVAMISLSELEELSEANREEIQHLEKRIRYLEDALDDSMVDCIPWWDWDED